ncbi:hypothetical protein N9L47_01795 [Rhodobacteraceae bacterium]|nr:hypothetical protein [Paracoccaceae bacterium]
MTQHTIQSEIDRERDRQCRIETQVSAMPPHQKNRLEFAQREAELALARVFGHRLNSQVAARIVEGMVLNPAVLCTVGGGVNELPTTPRGWDAFAKEAANAEPLAKLSIDHADGQLRESLRREALDKMNPARKMAMAREGTLDSHLEQSVKERLEARSF